MANTMVWVLALLLNNPEMLAKAQDELDTKVGKDRLVEESDIPNLNYLQALLKETLRMYPVGPLLVPHEAMEDRHVDYSTKLSDFGLAKDGPEGDGNV
ncbi:hypothetical protein Sjap_005412 [Stephania japonica]|uniref:Cytochrome P450 n=1 Tax=Stephania japonica TaxID=461633 RepID=A0AAP0PK20_9MAGN